MDYTVKCAKCFNPVDKSKCFIKSVIHLIHHPDEYRENTFCSTKCIREYMEEQQKKKDAQEKTPCQTYNWGGGIS